LIKEAIYTSPKGWKKIENFFVSFWQTGFEDDRIKINQDG